MGAASSDGHRIDVVEDDASIGSAICDALRSHGYQVVWHRNGRDALASFEVVVPDGVLLDAGLPDIDGVTLCRWLRERHPELPILFVTARDAEIDIVLGLDAGATDYISKPFSMNVLLARLRAHLRILSTADVNAPIHIGSLKVDPAAFVASIGTARVDLRPREFELLAYLARRAGRVVTRDKLLADVWDLHWESSTKTVDMHIVALRRKLGEAVEIATVRGVGYRLELP